MIRTLAPSSLPPDWQTHPAPLPLVELGRRWAEEKEHPVLKVPSAVRGEAGWNYLINPRHPDFSRIRRLEVKPFCFDLRFSG